MNKISKVLDFIGIISEFGLYAIIVVNYYSIFKDAYAFGHLCAEISILIPPILAGGMLWERIRK